MDNMQQESLKIPKGLTQSDTHASEKLKDTPKGLT
jgi:hypothetical protein